MRHVRPSLAIAIGLALTTGIWLMPSPAVASSPATVEAIAVLYGKFDTQIQFVICLKTANVADQNVQFIDDTLAYSYVVKDLSGAVVDSGSQPPSGVTYLSVPTCFYGYQEAYAADGLQPGTTYTVETTTTLTSKSNPSVVQTLYDTLTVTTTGGCPLGAPQEEPPAYSYLHALLDANNVVREVNSIAPGTVLLSPWNQMGTWAAT